MVSCTRSTASCWLSTTSIWTVEKDWYPKVTSISSSVHTGPMSLMWMMGERDVRTRNMSGFMEVQPATSVALMETS